MSGITIEAYKRASVFFLGNCPILVRDQEDAAKVGRWAEEETLKLYDKHILEELDRPMLKIEAGKWYKTKDGAKALCVGRGTLGLVIEMGDYLRYCHDNGQLYGAYPAGMNIIEEWREPITKTVEIQLLADGSTYNVRDDIPNASLKGVIGSVKVTLTEGQFAK